jgi:hypothetical protein
MHSRPFKLWEHNSQAQSAFLRCQLAFPNGKNHLPEMPRNHAQSLSDALQTRGLHVDSASVRLTFLDERQLLTSASSLRAGVLEPGVRELGLSEDGHSRIGVLP